MQKIILRILLVVFQSFLFIAITGCMTTVYEEIPNTATTPSLTAISLTLTPTIAATPAETVAPTATENAPASTEWQVSPDGHIVYNESELYGGLFTINSEHPEFVEEYWENTLRGLWQINYVGKNDALLNQFPTADSLVEHFRNGGAPIHNLQIPVPYPEEGVRFNGQGALIATNNAVDLSSIALSIYKPTKEEIYAFTPNYKRNNFLSYRLAQAQVLIEEMNMNGKNILKFTHRSDMLMDSSVEQQNRGAGYTITTLALIDTKSPEENLSAALQLIRSFNYTSQHISKENELGALGLVFIDENKPFMLNFNGHGFIRGDVYDELAEIANSPIRIR